MNCSHILQEVYVTVLVGTRMQQDVPDISTPTQKSAVFLFSHLVCVEGIKDDLHAGGFFRAGAAVNPKDPLELVEVQIPAGTFAGKPPVELLDVLQTHLLLRSTLHLTHGSSQGGEAEIFSPVLLQRDGDAPVSSRRPSTSSCCYFQPVRQIQLTRPNPCGTFLLPDLLLMEIFLTYILILVFHFRNSHKQPEQQPDGHRF